MTVLDYFKSIKKANSFSPWEIAIAFSVFNSVDAFLNEPSEDEYMKIYQVCYRAYLKSDGGNLVRIADAICELYCEGKIKLDELASKSEWEILDLLDTVEYSY